MFDDFFGFPEWRDFRNIDRKLYGHNAARKMKTDVHEHGVLSLTIPKKDARRLPEKKVLLIEG